ncbi:MAG: DMT family transporter [Pseudomonadota bacterium]
MSGQSAPAVPLVGGLRLIGISALAMTAFAANSVLCRLALVPGADGTPGIDAASFTAIRTVSGALVLAIVVLLRERALPARGQDGPLSILIGQNGRPARRDLRAAAALFAYMAFFSLGYLGLAAGTGALVLFGAVQVTMLSVAVATGEHFGRLGWAGFLAALIGLVWLVSPGVTAPDPLAAGSMALAGIAWGLFSLWGRGAGEPVGAMTRAFLLSVPAALLFLAGHAAVAGLVADLRGVLLAVASGAVASGLGYVAWYAVLPALGAGRAATVQLSVPVLAAIAGVLLLSEPLTLRLLGATALVLGGVLAVLQAKARLTAASAPAAR